MKKLHVLIIDDEPLARERIRRLLSDQSTVEILRECESGTDAIEAIHALKPDLIFLDVQMPEVDGFAVLAAIPSEARPAVIFTTAFDQFAVKAFEVHALDYILKPFDRERLLTAVEKARRSLKSDEATDQQARLTRLIEEVRPAKPAPDRISVKSGGKITLLRPEDIDWIEASDNYVTLRVGKVSHMIRETMTSMESQLEGKKFLRVSRSTIVNVERVKELHSLFHGDYVIVLHDGTKLNASRNYREKLKAAFGV